MSETFTTSSPDNDARIIPQGAAPLAEFPSVLRQAGFMVAPEQTVNFIEAVGLLGPRDMTDIHRAARATLAPPQERREDFDALFRSFFMGQVVAASTTSEDDDDITIVEEGEGQAEMPEPEEANEVGGEAIDSEVLTARGFAEVDEAEALRRFRRNAAARLPRRKAYRREAAKNGPGWNMRRALKEAVRRDGEVVELPKLRRQTKQRRIVLLIDISGSMKEFTDAYLRFAHTLVAVADEVEVFTLGTRLTRITSALRRRNSEQALATASGLVSDWDGGTRIGDALDAFLAVPRFSGFVRGASVLILSDGLERGDHSVMTQAVDRLARRAWGVHWLSPLAAETDYAPRTEALQSIVPFLARFADASSVERLCTHVLSIARRAA